MNTHRIEAQSASDFGLPLIAPGASDVIEIDFVKIKQVSSMMIRSWMIWSSALPSGVQVDLHNCSPALVVQFNTVQGFLSPSMTVESFEIPYYCESCDMEKTFSVENGKDYYYNSPNKTVKFPDQMACTCEQGQMMKPDINVEKYFRFLRAL